MIVFVWWYNLLIACDLWLVLFVLDIAFKAANDTMVNSLRGLEVVPLVQYFHMVLAVSLVHQLLC
jgi:hypothetical protein